MRLPKSTVSLLDSVALLDDRPDPGLVRGQLGNAVEQLATDVWEVEFSDADGRAYAFAALSEHALLVLRTSPVPG